MQTRKVITTIFLALFANVSSSSEFTGLDKFVLDAKALTHSVSGTSVVIIEDGRVVHELHQGFSDVENETAIDTNSVYYFASTTKSLMAFAVLLAEEQKKLNQQSSLQELFPNIEFRYIDPAKYTVKELLSHTSGLSNDAMTWTFSYTGEHTKEQREYFVSTIRVDPQHPKGTFNYSNLGYNVMAIWLDTQYANGWQAGLSELLFEPLDMKNTTANIDSARNNKWPIVKPYSYKYKDGKSSIYMNKTNNTLYSVGVFSRPTDIAHFLTSLMPINKAKSPFPTTVITASQKQIATGLDSYYSAYGWGWQHAEIAGEDALLHTGGFDGSSVQISYVPSKNIGVVVVHNESGLIANQLNKHINELAYSTLLRKDSIVEMKSAYSDMGKVAKYVEKAKFDLKIKREELEVLTSAKKHKLASVVGTYHNKDVGKLIIKSVEGDIFAFWGDLQSKLYINSDMNFILELRPGKFFELERSIDGENLSIEGWQFDKTEGDRHPW